MVGAFAVALYSRPRYTKDLDIWVEPSPENARKIVKALKEFGFRSLKLSERDFMKAGKIIQLGYEPVRVDLVTSIQGLNFNEAWRSKEWGRYGKLRVPFIGRKALIKNKKAANREQDRADLKILLK